MTTTTSSAKRLIWNGSPLFGRLPKCGKSFLLSRGWTVVEEENNDDSLLLQFAWPNKSGPQLETNQVKPALIRPYPTRVTDVLDDKVKLAQLLEGSGIAPDCLESPPLQQQANNDVLYFVKHRHGAQGKSVYPYNQDELQKWWNRTNNAHDFVIQTEVPPALDDEGRKFVLRSHVLLVQSMTNLQAYLHKDIICLTHASQYSCGKKSAHVSQAGKRHPPPVLLEHLHETHPAQNLYPAIYACSKTLVQLASSKLLDVKIAEGVTCFALMGTDLLVSDKIVICEVNSHPALGWGTMKEVSPEIFTRLIHDTLKVAVLGNSNKETGFEELETFLSSKHHQM